VLLLGIAVGDLIRGESCVYTHTLSDYAVRCGCSCDLDARSSPTPEVGLLEGMQPLGGVPRALSEMVSFVSLGRI
jgi:hypothetical protein